MQRSLQLLLLALALGATAAAPAPAQGGPRRLIDGVVAVVNGEIITRSQVLERAAPTLAQLQRAGEGDDLLAQQQVVQQAFSVLVDEQLLASELKARGIALGEADLNRAIDDIRARSGMSLEEMKQAVEQQGMGWDAYRQRLGGEILRYQLLSAEVQSKIEVTDEEVRAHLARRGITVGGEEVRVRHILFKVPEGASPEAVAAKRAEAEAALARVRGGEDFGEVARALSEDPSAEKGGDLGWFGRGLLVRAVEDAAFDTADGQVAGPVRSPFGWHLVSPLTRRTKSGWREDTRVEEARQALMTEQLEHQTRRYLGALRAKAVIEIKDPSLVAQ